VRRGLYYCCRLISAQYETEFTKDNYDDIKKVYSIWICTDVPDYAKNTVTRYKITEENIVGNLKNDFQKYDLINVIMVCLDKDKEEVGNDSKGILKLLRVLLSDKMMAGKKKNILSSDFDIAMNVEIEEEMSRMCNLSEGVLERGRIEGRAEGRAEGRVEGRAEGRVEGRAEGRVEGRTEGQEMANVESLKNIMEGFSVTFEKAAETLKIPVNEWEKYRSKLL
jgi:hypothetical protein